MTCNTTKVHEIIEQSLKQGSMPVYNFRDEEELNLIEEEMKKFLFDCDSYIGANTAVRILLNYESISFLQDILENPSLSLHKLDKDDQNRIVQTIIEGFSSKAWKNKFLGDDSLDQNIELSVLSLYKSMNNFVSKFDEEKYNTNIRNLLDTFVFEILSRTGVSGKQSAIKYFVNRINAAIRTENVSIQAYMSFLYRISARSFLSEIKKYSDKAQIQNMNTEVTIFDSFSNILYYSLEKDELLARQKNEFINVWKNFYEFLSKKPELKATSRALQDKLMISTIKSA